VSLLDAPRCRLANGRVIVEDNLASTRWPLIGFVGPIVWAFDGSRLWLTHVAFNRAARAA
jgi:hypothetical protein